MLPCALLTVHTVLLASLTGVPLADAVLRPSWFALLYWFFRGIGRRYADLRGLPMRWIESGFLVLAAGFATSSAIALLGLAAQSPALQQLQVVCERGAFFLLGLTLIAFGLMSWLPTVLESHRLLRQRFAWTHGRLQDAEHARSRMEARLVEADRLGLLGELAAGVAHDLRNPLAIIRGTADSLGRRARSADEVKEHIEVLRRSIDRADKTITALIDLGRPPRAGARSTAIDTVVRDVLALVLVESRRLQLTISSPRTTGAIVRGDRALLQQTLLNLVLNAMQASRAGDTIAVRTRCHPALGAVAIAVDDRGCGLPENVRRQLFTPFFTTKPDGTGLGLLSCRRIALEMGGRLGITPRRRGGARALLLLPLASTPQPERQPLGAPR
ncbi:MAG: hypothetical protein IPK26_12085 [Planctomycetes bacterium]|nr:hypothetical protein [Planctomycetota bacterium]